jgi:hypothetical protein
VRSLVGIITTIATVIHFTFGCCLNPCHGGGRGECVSHAIPAAACDECCHDDHDRHQHDEAAGEADGVSCDVADSSLVAVLVSDSCHPCQGCHCAATSSEVVTHLKWSPLASGIMATIESEAITLFAVVGGKHPPDPHLHPCPRGQALFERLLI